MKDLENKAMMMGKEGFLKGLKNIPAANLEFMSWIAKDFNSWDEKIMKQKIKLYKSYSKGWALAWNDWAVI